MLSALKHGLFRKSFLLCDRCVYNGSCESFEPGGRCGLEEEMYESLVSKFVKKYFLDGVADMVMVRRAAMNIIRIARAEAYEASIGVSEKSMDWGRYIAMLDKSLRGSLREMALTRSSRKEGEKGDLAVDIEHLLRQVELKVEGGMMGKVKSPLALLLDELKAEQTADRRGRGEVCEEAAS